jgi:hypothetical protein
VVDRGPAELDGVKMSLPDLFDLLSRVIASGYWDSMMISWLSVCECHLAEQMALQG